MSSFIQELVEIELDIIRASEARSDILSIALRLHETISRHLIETKKNRFYGTPDESDEEYPGDSIPDPSITKEFLDEELDGISRQINQMRNGRLNSTRETKFLNYPSQNQH